MTNIIYANEPLNNLVNYSVFMAGPTPRTNILETSWRPGAVELFKKFNFSGNILLPEPKDGIWAGFEQQVAWELEGLEKADVVMFWVPRELPDMPGFTTNVEFGMLVKSGRCVYGRPNFADKIEYLDYIYNKFTGKTPVTTLEGLVSDIIRLAGKA